MEESHRRHTSGSNTSGSNTSGSKTSGSKTSGYSPAAYGDAFADVYDDWYEDISDTDGTVEFLARLAGEDPVLELGVGTGRIALPLSARGVEVHGIDASQPMLERLREKPGGTRIKVTLGDFADIGIGGSFGVVVATYNTFFTLPSHEAQRRCLANAARRLRRGGALVIEGFVVDDDAPESTVTPRLVERDRVVLQVALLDHDDQTISSQHITLSAEGIQFRPSFLCWVTPEQLDDMAAEADLTLESRWAGWREQPFTSDSQRHVSVYRRQG